VVSGGGEGQGVVLLGALSMSFVKVETQGLPRATQPTSRSETWQADQANSFVRHTSFGDQGCSEQWCGKK